MKKLTALIVVLLPIVALAQYGGTKTPEQFHLKYSESSGYKSFEINKEDLNDLINSKDTKRKLKSILEEIQHINYLEYKNQPRSVRGKLVLEQRPNSGNVVFMSVIPDTSKSNTSSNSSELANIAALQYHTFPSAGPIFLYSLASKQINFKPFSFVQTLNEHKNKIEFLKRKDASGLNEYLLIKNNIMIILKGAIDLKDYNELEDLVAQILTS